MSQKKQNKKNVRPPLYTEIYKKGIMVNLSVSAIAMVYLLAVNQFPFRFVPRIVLLGALIVGINQFIVAPLTGKLILQSVSDDLDSFYNFESTPKERTRLMKQLMSSPAKMGLEIFLIFMLGIIIWFKVITSTMKISHQTEILFFSIACIGAYTDFVLGLGVSQKICSAHAAKVVAQGISKAEIDEKHSFGIASTAITSIHIFLPIMILNGVFTLISYIAVTFNNSAGIVLSRLLIIAVVNTVLYCILSSMLFKRMMKSIHTIRDAMENIDRSNLYSLKRTPTDLSNEFMYNIYLINSIVDVLQRVLKTSAEISQNVVESSNELSVISKETAVTSLEQASGVKELLAAMEESDTLAKNISEKIGEVSIVAKKTTSDINEGFDILNKNIEKIQEIKMANKITMEGIKTLTEKISGISDITGIINSIADQTNIVAFNAEIEASSAGDVGQNFTLVADEIRRLTNKTIQQTNEIRSQILEIQRSSETLLQTSQNGSKKIHAEGEIINTLFGAFSTLKESSESTDQASDKIKEIINQQTSSFEQIVITLRQISEAAEGFSASTQKISTSAKDLCDISDKLKGKMANQEEGSGSEAGIGQAGQESPAAESVKIAENSESEMEA